MAYRVLVPEPRIEPVPPAVEAQILKRWTTGKFPDVCFSKPTKTRGKHECSSSLLQIMQPSSPHLGKLHECNGWALPWENHLRDHVISPLGKYRIHNFSRLSLIYSFYKILAIFLVLCNIYLEPIYFIRSSLYLLIPTLFFPSPTSFSPLYLWVCSLFVTSLLLVLTSLLYILDSTYKWYHTVFVCLTYFIHVVEKRQGFIFMSE